MAFAALLSFAFFWERASLPIGRLRPKPFQNGFQNVSADWLPRSSIAALPSAAQFLHFWFFGFSRTGDGVRRSWFLEFSACSGLFSGASRITRRKTTHASRKKSGP